MPRLLPLLMLAFSLSRLGAGVLIFDGFSGMAGTLNSTVPETAAGGAAWFASTTVTNAFALNGSGGLTANTGASQSAYLNLGASYFSSNPGVYTLSMTVAYASASAAANTSWVGFGFSTNAVDTSLTLQNGTINSEPFLLYRNNGAIDVYQGPNVTNGKAYSGSTSSPVAPGGSSYTLSLVIDTSSAQWTYSAYIGSTLLVSGAYSSNPTDLRYLVLSTGSSVGSATATVDSFSLSYAAAPEPSSLALIAGGAALALAGALRVSRLRAVAVS